MMSVTNIKSKPCAISFKGKIIDSHVHTGKWGESNFGVEALDSFIKTPLTNGDTVEKMIVSNLDCIDNNGILDEISGNKKLLQMIDKNPAYAPLAVCQPNLTNGDSAHIETLLKENPKKFVGFKFHPKSMKLNADSNLYDKYLEIASKHNLPCLFHSDKTFDTTYPDGSKCLKDPHSRPEQIYTLAKRHKDVPVILGHMGGDFGQNTQAAVDIIVESINKGDAKLYADISWVNCNTPEKPDIIAAIKKLMSTEKGDMTEKLLFGTDTPLGRFGGSGENGINPHNAYSNTVKDIKAEIRKNFGAKADEIIEKIFYKNADKLFFNNKEQVSKKSSSLLKKLSIGGLVVVAAGAATAIYLNFKKKNAQNETTNPQLNSIIEQNNTNQADSQAFASFIK